MRIELVRRKEPSQLMLMLTPLIAVAAALIVGGALFSILGFNGIEAINLIFVTPIINMSYWEDLAIKAGPLITIGLGLAICFRANVWNIGAEGQYVAGGLAGALVALGTWGMQGPWILPAMIIAGVLGGMAWAAIPALLRTRLGVSEILTSLMLTYAAIQLLYYCVNGPMQDPTGRGFPESRLFDLDRMLPYVHETSFVFINAPIALLLAVVIWAFMSRSLFGYQVRAVGAAPQAARYGGFDQNRTIWWAMLLSGGLAGLAGVFEAAGPFGQVVPAFPTGYGFTAIIIAFLGRLHPIGVVIAGLVLAVSYVGGETAQARIGISASAAGVFQALLLFILLATDVFVRFRLRVTARRQIAPAAKTAPAASRSTSGDAA